MPSLTLKQLELRRHARYRRTPGRRVRTPAAAQAFVDEVGFCFFWPIQGAELPNLFHAIAGRVRAVPNEHADPDISKCWTWKDQALGQRRWYYGKLLCKKATLIALTDLPNFYALSANYGGEHDYLDEYAAGHLSREAKVIYEALSQGGPLDTVRLRRETRLAAESAKAAFERALVELQVGLKILPVGVAEAGAWRYAFVYDLVSRHFPDLPAQAQTLPRSQARAVLVERYLTNVVAATRAEVRHIFSALKWTPTEWEHTWAALRESGRIEPVTLIDQAGEYWGVPAGRAAPAVKPRPR